MSRNRIQPVPIADRVPRVGSFRVNGRLLGNSEVSSITQGFEHARLNTLVFPSSILTTMMALAITDRTSVFHSAPHIAAALSIKFSLRSFREINLDRQ